MATITLKGNPIHTSGSLPPIGSQAPDFVLVDAALNDVTLATYAGKQKLLNIVPSLDTPVCAMSTRRFSTAVKNHPQAVFLMVSADLPFAMSRFCKAEGTENVISLSLMRSRDFARDYGVLIEDGHSPVSLLGPSSSWMPRTRSSTRSSCQIAHEPDYDLALAALRG